MNKKTAVQSLYEIYEHYENLEEPKFKQLSKTQWERYLLKLEEMKQFIKGDEKLKSLINGISQVVAKIDKLSKIQRIKGKKDTGDDKDENILMNTSERGVNKAIPCIRNKNHSPFSWKDGKCGTVCTISNGIWGAKNSMLLDALSYMILMKEGGDIFPKEQKPIFNSLENIKNRESEFPDGPNKPVSPDVEIILKSKYYIKFTDKDFRELVAKEMNSNSILDLIYKTSQLEFKIVYPVRIIENKKSGEQLHKMNIFSRLFEFGYIDKHIRKSDNAVTCREYYLSFNTILGELFVHNLKTLNFDWIDRRFYSLPGSSQIFYKRFILNNDKTPIPILLSTISRWLNFSDKNITNLVNTVESNVLDPLKKCDLIKNYKKENGPNGLKYKIEIDR